MSQPYGRFDFWHPPQGMDLIGHHERIWELFSHLPPENSSNVSLGGSLDHLGVNCIDPDRQILAGEILVQQAN
jgi:hypothetical protein